MECHYDDFIIDEILLVQTWMRLDISSPKAYHSVIQGFVAYLIKDNVLNDLYGKTLGILSFYSATKKTVQQKVDKIN